MFNTSLIKKLFDYIARSLTRKKNPKFRNRIWFSGKPIDVGPEPDIQHTSKWQSNRRKSDRKAQTQRLWYVKKLHYATILSTFSEEATPNRPKPNVMHLLLSYAAILLKSQLRFSTLKSGLILC